MIVSVIALANTDLFTTLAHLILGTTNLGKNLKYFRIENRNYEISDLLYEISK